MSSETTGSTGVYEFLAWFEVNKKKVAWGFVALVIVGVVAAYFRWRNQNVELQANQALLQLRPTPSGQGAETQPSAESFSKVAASFPSTEAAERALLLSAGTLFTEGKYAEAQAQFERFLEKHADHPLAPNAAYGRAAALEAQGKQDEALAAYQNLLTRYPRSFLTDRTKLSVARIYEAKNQPEQALKQYDELIDPQGARASASEALAMKEALLKRHPELVKPAAPPASTNATAPSASVTNATGITNATAPSAATTNR